MAGLKVAEAAPVSCTSTAPDVEARVVKPVGAGTVLIPEKVAVESIGALNVNVGVAVSTFVDPSAFFAVITVLGGSVALTVARYPEVPGAEVTVVAVTPVVAEPSGLTVAAAIVEVAEGFITTGASSPPPHPYTIIKAPSNPPMINFFNNLLILNTSCFLIGHTPCWQTHPDSCLQRTGSLSGLELKLLNITIGYMYKQV